MVEHTQTPWVIDEYYHPNYISTYASLAIYEKKAIDDPLEPCSPVCVITPLELKEEIDQANAEFIVRACNNYDKVIRALNMAYGIVESEGYKETEEIKKVLIEIGEL